MAYAWAGKMDVSVKLDCGCTVPWHDASDLFIGVYGWCPEHGDSRVVEVLDPPVLERVEHDGLAQVWRVGNGKGGYLYVFPAHSILAYEDELTLLPNIGEDMHGAPEATVSDMLRICLHRPDLSPRLGAWQRIVTTARAFLRKEAPISDLRAAVREVYPANGG